MDKVNIYEHHYINEQGVSKTYSRIMKITLLVVTTLLILITVTLRTKHNIHEGFQECAVSYQAAPLTVNFHTKNL